MKLPDWFRINEVAFQPSCNSCDAQLLSNPPLFSQLAESRYPLSHHWCSDCLSQILGPPRQHCLRCGAYLERNNPFETGCKICFRMKLHFQQAFAIGNYRGLLQKLVLDVKRGGNDVLGLQLGRLLGFCLIQLGLPDSIDEVTPMPTHWRRKLTRGLHPSALIASGVARYLQLPVRSRNLICKRHTKKQATLSNTARVANVRAAFDVPPKARVAGKNILLVDDVMTSGATMTEAAKTLLNAGAQTVYVGVVARGARSS